MTNTKQTAVVIDGNSLMYRMFYATSNLAEYAVQNNLVPVNAVKLMIETCLKLKQNNYNYCLVAFDHDKKTLRHEMFSEYKAGRKKMPNELVTQIPLIKEALDLIGFKTMSLEGIEADDLIGSFCKLMNNSNIHVDIYTSDKDMLQLVNELNYVHLIKTGLTNIIINTKDNFANLNNNLTPQQIPDFKAIVGDKSDNLLGVNGIGEKTGLALLNQFTTLDNIYNNLNCLTKSQQEKFLTCKDQAYMCKQLATIDSSIFNQNCSINDFLIKETNTNKMNNFLTQYKINGLQKYLHMQVNIFDEKEIQ